MLSRISAYPSIWSCTNRSWKIRIVITDPLGGTGQGNQGCTNRSWKIRIVIIVSQKTISFSIDRLHKQILKNKDCNSFTKRSTPCLTLESCKWNSWKTRIVIIYLARQKTSHPCLVLQMKFLKNKDYNTFPIALSMFFHARMLQMKFLKNKDCNSSSTPSSSVSRSKVANEILEKQGL